VAEWRAGLSGLSEAGAGAAQLHPDVRVVLRVEGCAVSPHCDAVRKLATHIFYFNTEADWDPGWGGRF